MDKGKAFRIAGIAFLIGAMIYGLWLYFRPNPLIGAAKGMRHALVSGDGQALYDYATALEKDCTRLTPDKLRKAWEILIGPRLARSKHLRDEPVNVASNLVQAVGSSIYRDDDGNTWQIAVIAEQTEEGPKSTPLIFMLLCSDITLADIKAGQSKTAARVAKYRAALEAIGIQRILLNPSSCLTWDQLEAKLCRRSDTPVGLGGSSESTGSPKGGH